MSNSFKKILSIAAIIAISACTTIETTNPVNKDILFLVLGKMSIYTQDNQGTHVLRDHHFVAEIMPKENGKILGGTLTSLEDPDFQLPFKPEGPQFLAHGVRVTEAEELHEAHPDGTYLFNYKTQNGEMVAQPLTLKRRSTTDIMPLPATLTLTQNGNNIDPSLVDPTLDLTIHWTPMNGNMRAPDSELDDLIFVLAFDCFGNNIAHSGRPYNGKPYLTYQDKQFTIPADELKQGVSYNLIVEQATADVMRHQGVPGIATYATLTFLDAHTSGQSTCPVN